MNKASDEAIQNPFVPRGLQVLLDAPRELIEFLPVAAYACDKWGRILWFNERAAALWGREPRIGDDSELFCGSWRLFFEGREISHEETPMAIALRTGEAVEGAEGLVERPDGSRVWATVHVRPVKDAAGHICGAINCFHDTTELHQAKAQATERAADTRHILDAMPIAIYTTDAAGRITYYNEAAVKLAGREPALGSDEWCVTWKLYWPDGTPLPHDECPMAVALKENRSIYGAEACAERPDGGHVPFLAYPVPLRDTTGAVTGAVNTLVDISERKRQEAALRASEERYRTLFEAVPMAVFVCDRHAVIQTCNRHAVEMWGREPQCGVEKHCGSVKLWLPDGTLLPHTQSPVVEVLRTGVPARGVEVSIERPDGTRVPVLVNFAALKNASGEITGAITTFVDISERKRQEAEMGRLAAIVEHSDDAIVSKDINGIIETWNQGAERLFGYTTEEVIGKPVNILIPVDHDDEEPRILARIRSGQSIERYDTVRRRKDGSLVDISLTESPIKNAMGKVIGASKIARDISARRDAEAHRELLLHELAHRVKNTLATVQSIVVQTLHNAQDPEAFKTTFQARLAALAHTHDLLLHSNWAGTTLCALLDRSLTPYQNGQQSQWTIEGQDIQINPKATLALGMVLHELATNAAKYGALSRTAGCVDVTWQIKRDGSLHLTWTERDGPRVKPPERRGFGSRLIEEGLEYELDAEVKLDYQPTGLRCTIDVALEAVTPTMRGGDE